MELSEFPRKSLALLPTPLVELPRLSAALGGPRIFMKRDDQTGLATGGNKARKLEFLIGDAIAQGCDTIITGGAAQSNHCRQTAAAVGGLRPGLPPRPRRAGAGRGRRARRQRGKPPARQASRRAHPLVPES